MITHGKVRTVLQIPVPKVLKWSGHVNNSVESEYILMEEATGTPLYETWDSLEISNKLKIIDGIVGIEKRMSSVSFTMSIILMHRTDVLLANL